MNRCALAEPRLDDVVEPLYLARKNAADIRADYAAADLVDASGVWIELASIGVPLEGARAGVSVDSRRCFRYEIPFGPRWAVQAAEVLLWTYRQPEETVLDFLRGCLTDEALRAHLLATLGNAAHPDHRAVLRLMQAVM